MQACVFKQIRACGLLLSLLACCFVHLLLPKVCVEFVGLLFGSFPLCPPPPSPPIATTMKRFEKDLSHVVGWLVGWLLLSSLACCFVHVFLPTQLQRRRKNARNLCRVWLVGWLAVVVELVGLLLCSHVFAKRSC